MQGLAAALTARNAVSGARRGLQMPVILACKSPTGGPGPIRHRAGPPNPLAPTPAGARAALPRRRTQRSRPIMSTTEPIRPDAASPGAAPPGAAEPARPLLPQAFRAGDGGAEDRLIAQVAFALAAEKGQAATPEALEALRAQAAAALSDFSFRYLHNRVEEVRREAAAAEAARVGRPPGFLTLVLANLLALAVGGAVAVWMAAHPDTIAGLIGR